MNNNLKLGGVITAIVAGTLFTATASAHQAGQANAGYVGDGNGHYITDGSGNCVKTSSWTDELWTVDCGKPAPVEAAAPPPPPAPPPAPTYETVTLTAGALFDLNKSNLKPAGMQQLDELADKIQRTDRVVDVKVVGHTDSSGAEAYNQALSVRRATTVRDYLASKGVDPNLMSVSGMGESQPVADNRTSAGRAQNRRVEVSIGVSRKQ
ncbi:MAG: OmpA family protein [Pseudomonadota bacterium]